MKTSAMRAKEAAEWADICHAAMEFVAAQSKYEPRGYEEWGPDTRLLTDRSLASTVSGIWGLYKREMYSAIEHELVLLDERAQKIGRRLGPAEMVAAMDPEASKEFEKRRLASAYSRFAPLPIALKDEAVERRAPSPKPRKRTARKSSKPKKRGKK